VRNKIIRKMHPAILIMIVLMLICGCARGKKGKSQLTTLTFWHSFTASTLPILEQMIGDFEVGHPDIHINAQYVPTGDALAQKLITAIQSNTTPDIAWVHADFLDKLVNARAIYALDELAGNDTLFQNQYLPDIFPQLLQTVTIRDTLYALPMEATTLALLYNRDLFQDVGLNPDHPPATWVELDSFTLRLCRDLNRDDIIDRFGFYVPVFPASGPLNIWMIMQWAPFVWQAGGEIFDRDKPMFNTAAGTAALSLWRKLYQQQQFERFSMAHDMGFMSQTVAMIMDGPWNLPRYREQIKFDWGVAPLPGGHVGRATYLAGEYLVVFRKCANPSVAWQFLCWFIMPEVQRDFAEKSGYLPVCRSVLNDPDYIEFLKHYPQQQSFNEQLQYARGRTLPDKYRVEVNQCLAKAIESTVRGGVPPDKSLKIAEDEIRKLLMSE